MSCQCTVDLETPLAELTGPVDVLRVGHHGSQTSSALSALQRWAPRLAVLSLGTDNAYCHPHPDVLSRLATLATHIAATGSGIVDDSGGCTGPTNWPPNAQPDLGDIVVELSADGTLTLEGEVL